ncbi:hypothetical protein, partial [Marinifilum caeruleilacunae]
MKYPILKILFAAFLISLTLNSFGQEQKSIKRNSDQISKILIQFFPCFIAPTQLLVDVSNKELTFYRFGGKERLLPPSPPADSLKPDYDPNVYVQKFPIN